MKSVHPYINFPGNTEEAFNFYKSVFGGELTIIRFKDMPDVEKVPEQDRNKIMHIALPMGKQMLMATDALESLGQTIEKGNNHHILVSCESKQEADKFFNGLSAGGFVMVPMSDQVWGDYFGMCTDKYGVQWMISYNPKDN